MEGAASPGPAITPTGPRTPALGVGTGSRPGSTTTRRCRRDLAPSGQIVAAGGWESFPLARSGSGGGVDAGFDGTGALFPGYKGAARLAYAVFQVQKDGRLVAAGYVNDDVTSETDFALARFDTDGSLDASFGGDGMVTTDFSGGGDYARAIALQPDGKVVVAGRTESLESDFAVARYEGDPPPPTVGPFRPLPVEARTTPPRQEPRTNPTHMETGTCGNAGSWRARGPGGGA
jgi:uncharacterized delta-60 repeat protein